MMPARDERLAVGLRDVIAQCIEAYLVDPRDQAVKFAAQSYAVGVAMAAVMRALEILGDEQDVLERLRIEPIMRFVTTRGLTDREKLQCVHDELELLLANIRRELSR